MYLDFVDKITDASSGLLSGDAMSPIGVVDIDYCDLGHGSLDGPVVVVEQDVVSFNFFSWPL